ncbi:MAG: mechanosensitive ion channel domain-containing protein [Myxococcota bacterium]
MWAVALWLAVGVGPSAVMGQEGGTDGTAAEAGTASDAAQAEAGVGGESGSQVDGGSEGGSGGSGGSGIAVPEQAASDAERIVRIRRGIKLDKRKLRALKEELEVREAWFERLAKGMTDVSARIKAAKEALAALGDDANASPDDVAAAKTRVGELEEDYELFNRQTDLALTGEKKTKTQIDALAVKIKTEERSLAELTGKAKRRPPKVVVGPGGAAAPTGGTQSTSPLPPGIAPGLPATAPTSSQTPTDEPASSVATAAQLRAQRLLAEQRRDLAQARFEVENYVERKRALETQLELEDDLAKTEADEVENLIKARGVWEARNKRALEDGNEERKARSLRAITAINEFVAGAEQSVTERAQYRESLRERLGFIEEEGLRVHAVAEEARAELDKAQRRLIWLKSPVHPDNILHWAKRRGPRILLVMAMMGLLLLLLQFGARGFARTFIRRRRGSRSGGTGRADTLAFSFASAGRVLIIVIGVLLALQEAGLDIRTVLGGAAIVGVAFAFGAQDLMRDYFSGFLILLEDQYQLGDLITINGITGTVESVNMRVTVLRDLEGRVHFVPNGEIKAVTNRTYAWGRPVFEIPVGYDEDVDRVMEVLLELANDFMADPDWKPFVSGEPDMLGVDKFTDRGIIIKFMIRTQPDKLFPVRREMLRRISKRFNALGIKITVPHRLIESTPRGHSDPPKPQ